MGEFKTRQEGMPLGPCSTKLEIEDIYGEHVILGIRNPGVIVAEAHRYFDSSIDIAKVHTDGKNPLEYRVEQDPNRVLSTFALEALEQAQQNKRNSEVER